MEKAAKSHKINRKITLRTSKKKSSSPFCVILLASHGRTSARKLGLTVRQAVVTTVDTTRQLSELVCGPSDAIAAQAIVVPEVNRRLEAHRGHVHTLRVRFDVRTHTAARRAIVRASRQLDRTAALVPPPVPRVDIAQIRTPLIRRAIRNLFEVQQATGLMRDLSHEGRLA